MLHCHRLLGDRGQVAAAADSGVHVSIPFYIINKHASADWKNQVGCFQLADGKYQFKYHINGKPHFVYSWRLEPTDKLPVGKKPCLSLRELEKQIGYDLDSQMDPVGKNITVAELVERYLKTKTGVRDSTRAGYRTVQRILDKETFGGKKISQVKVSDAKLFLIKLQSDGRGYSSIHSIRGVRTAVR